MTELPNVERLWKKLTWAAPGSLTQAALEKATGRLWEESLTQAALGKRHRRL